jgi:hypothetical protein
MITAPGTSALSDEALYAKSKVYIGRALAARDRKSMDEYQLWASFALELLGKSALAAVHPCLIADPQSPASLFAAAGMSIGTDIKTIIAKTLFERLTHVSKRFDKKTQEYCLNMSLKRNAELHSGELPFEAAIQSAWEGRFWHTAEIVLEMKRQTIESWLGANDAKAPKELLAAYTHAVSQAAKVRIETAAEIFAALPKAEREERHARAARLETWEMYRKFRLLSDGIWETQCPACSSKAFLAGVKYSEDVSPDQEGAEPYEDIVDIYYVSEEFTCPSCGLTLDSRDEIEAAGLDVEHHETEVRQREYEPDYGND